MKRRVIAIAVVLAAVGLVGMNWEPLWRTVMLRRILATIHLGDEPTMTIYYVPRWRDSVDGEHATGSAWTKLPDGTIGHLELQHGEQRLGSVATIWDANGIVTRQELMKFPAQEERDSPPWWPHPPLIDLREFEE